MSNELMTLETTEYLALRPDSDLQAALAENIDPEEGISEKNLIKVPTPAAGATTWTIDEVDGEKSYKEIQGILVYYGKGGVIWPTNDPKPGTLPYLRTDDCRTAYVVGEESGDIDLDKLEQFANGDGTYNWRGLVDGPNAPFGFGTGKNGTGKRAQEYRVLCVLRKGDAFPLLVRAKPGSLKNVGDFINKLTAAGVPYFRAQVSLSLEKAQNGGGQPFSRIVPKLIGRLDQEAGEAVKRLYTEPLKNAVRSIGLDDEADE
jgi:hypothetical protein